jgi:hypothetical protein
MVHDELVRVARRLIGTGLPETIAVEVAAWSKFFADTEEPDPFPVAALAGMQLSSED